MKHLLTSLVLVTLVACNNSKKGEKTTTGDTTVIQTENTSPGNSNNAPAAGAASVSYTVAGAETNATASALVQKDKDKLSPGNDLIAMITSNSPGGVSFVLNFVFTPKPGVYPVVGYAYTREKEVYGGILGGKPKLTPYKVNLTECENLGSNNMGGNRWRLSGQVDEEITIPAMGIMKMDTAHPDEIKINKIRFANLTFDDNWEELLNKAMEKVKQ